MPRFCEACRRQALQKHADLHAPTDTAPTLPCSAASTHMLHCGLGCGFCLLSTMRHADAQEPALLHLAPHADAEETAASLCPAMAFNSAKCPSTFPTHDTSQSGGRALTLAGPRREAKDGRVASVEKLAVGDMHVGEPTSLPEEEALSSTYTCSCSGCAGAKDLCSPQLNSHLSDGLYICLPSCPISVPPTC